MWTKKIARVTLIILILVLFSMSCAGKAASTSTPSVISTTNTSKSTSTTVKTSPVATPVINTTTLARPAPGKPQELTFNLKGPGGINTLVIYLNKGEVLDLDWKFVSNPQTGIGFMFTTPEGREMNDKLQPINLPGHPLYDQNLTSQTPKEVVGTNLAIKVGQDKYCNEGYYSLVFSGNTVQSGTVYLRYSLETIAQ